MTTKKFLVKQVLMSTLTAGILSFSFSSCNDDDVLLDGGLTPETEQDYNGPLQEPYGLSYYDFLAAEDVTILNADTTQISVSKALADKMGIQSFLGHPMGIWDHPEHRPYLRRATREKLEGDRYILNVIQSSIAEVLAGNDKEYQLSTEVYVNTDPATTRTRAIENNTSEVAARYIDEKNVIHPMAITFRRAEGDQRALTRNAAAENGIYGTYLPEQLLGIQDDPATRNIVDDFCEFIGIKDFAKYSAEWFKAKAEEFEKWLKDNTNYAINWKEKNSIVNIDSKLDMKIPISCGKEMDDTVNVYVNAPVKFNLNYNIILQAEGSCVEKPNLQQFEASVDGRFNFEPEIRLGFDGKWELPEDKQKIDLVEFEGITVVFNIGYVPFTIDFNPSLYLKLKAELEGKATVGVKYEFDSWFKGGVKYDGHTSGISESKVTKSKISFLTPTAEFNASAGIGLMFGCEMIIDKLAGPELAVGPELTASAGLTIAPFEKDPLNFEASVDFGIAGEVGGKLKIWKWDIAEWSVPLDFGLNWNLFKYPSDNASDEVKKNMDEINKNAQKLIENKDWEQLNDKLNKDSQIKQSAKQYLRSFKIEFPDDGKWSGCVMLVEVSDQTEAIFNHVRDEFTKKYSRAPKSNDADFQTMKRMAMDKMKTFTKEEYMRIKDIKIKR